MNKVNTNAKYPKEETIRDDLDSHVKHLGRPRKEQLS